MEPKVWQEMPPGGIILEAGSSRGVETGSWRVSRPVVDWPRCVHCMICWAFCPDSAFLVQEMKLVDVDLDHCKGCGICAVECPRQCIAMATETDVAAAA
ncbi:MAG: 4Fe-4S binding protein [Chloroflexi bacterium]|nr:4Fe-4S binding protein [Chloroflexota bacterium]